MWQYSAWRRVASLARFATVLDLRNPFRCQPDPDRTREPLSLFDHCCHRRPGILLICIQHRRFLAASTARRDHSMQTEIRMQIVQDAQIISCHGECGSVWATSLV